AGGGGVANGSAPSGAAGKGGNSFPALSTAAAALGAAAPPNPSKWLTASALLHSGSAGNSAEFSVQEEEVRSMLSLFAQLGRARKDAGSSGGMDAATFQSRLSALRVRNQVPRQQALAGLAPQAPTEKPDQPMLLKLAEHVAIRFALDSYEKGELRVNAVKQLLDRMNTEIEALRKILTSQEEQMASAGLNVQSY